MERRQQSKIAIFADHEIAFTGIQIEILKYLEGERGLVTVLDLYKIVYSDTHRENVSIIGLKTHISGILESIETAGFDPNDFIKIHRRGDAPNAKIIGVEIPETADIKFS